MVAGVVVGGVSGVRWVDFRVAGQKSVFTFRTRKASMERWWRRVAMVLRFHDECP